jgi:hypothetical protein
VPALRENLLALSLEGLAHQRILTSTALQLG